MIAKQIRVHGDVQGVFYRHYTKKAATRAGVSGWVKNEHDGTVTIFVQGEKEPVESLVEWSREGSPMATVEKLEVADSEIDTSLKGFNVK